MSDDRIPVIDLAPYRDGTNKKGVAAAVRDAAQELGFLYVTGHGIDQALIDNAFVVSKDFFALPADVKQAIKANSSHRGYLGLNSSTYAGETKPNFNESFVMGFDLGADDPDVRAGVPLHGPNQWPDGSHAFRTIIEEYHRRLIELGALLLRIFGAALGLDDEYFLPHFSKSMPFVRLLHYPSQPPARAEDDYGIAPHTDYGFLTILAQDDVGGLEVRRRGGGWISAPYIHGTFVVNIADMLMQWTNDRWVSTPHRVINTTGRERYSIPFFFDPNYRTLVDCISSCRGPDNPAKYPPVTWGDYLKGRFDKTYDYRRADKDADGSPSR